MKKRNLLVCVVAVVLLAGLFTLPRNHEAALSASTSSIEDVANTTEAKNKPVVVHDKGGSVRQMPVMSKPPKFVPDSQAR